MIDINTRVAERLGLGPYKPSQHPDWENSRQAAWKLVEVLANPLLQDPERVRYECADFTLSQRVGEDGVRRFECTFTMYFNLYGIGQAETLPKAICLAFLDFVPFNYREEWAALYNGVKS